MIYYYTSDTAGNINGKIMSNMQ